MGKNTAEICKYIHVERVNVSSISKPIRRGKPVGVTIDYLNV